MTRMICRTTDRANAPCRPSMPARSAALAGLLRPLLLAAGLAAVALGAPGVAKAQLNGDMLGRMYTYTTHYDDTLLDVGRAARLGSIEVMSANPGVDPWLPGKDVTVLLPTAHLLPDAPRKGIVINTAELRLYYFGDPSQPLSFPIGVGRDGYLTPHGTTTIVRKKENPSWYLTPSEIADHPELPKVIPPGPDNPLGERAMYLGWPSYLIHGTNIPWGIGRRASRGCIRMYPENIEWLFSRIPVGTPVTVVDQPVKLGRMDGDLYIEVQPSPHQIDVMEETSKAPAPPEPIPVAEWSDRILIAAGPDIERIDWPAVEKALSDRQGFPIRIATSADHAGSPPAKPSPVEQPTMAVHALPAALAAVSAPAATAAVKSAAAESSNPSTPAKAPVAKAVVSQDKSSAAQSATAIKPAAKPAPAKVQSAAAAPAAKPTAKTTATAKAEAGKAPAAKAAGSKAVVAENGPKKTPAPTAKPNSSTKTSVSSEDKAAQRTASR